MSNEVKTCLANTYTLFIYYASLILPSVVRHTRNLSKYSGLTLVWSVSVRFSILTYKKQYFLQFAMSWLAGMWEKIYASLYFVLSSLDNIWASDDRRVGLQPRWLGIGKCSNRLLMQIQEI